MTDRTRTNYSPWIKEMRLKCREEGRRLYRPKRCNSSIQDENTSFTKPNKTRKDSLALEQGTNTQFLLVRPLLINT